MGIERSNVTATHPDKVRRTKTRRLHRARPQRGPHGNL